MNPEQLEELISSFNYPEDIAALKVELDKIDIPIAEELLGDETLTNLINNYITDKSTINWEAINTNISYSLSPDSPIVNESNTDSMNNIKFCPRCGAIKDPNGTTCIGGHDLTPYESVIVNASDATPVEVPAETPKVEAPKESPEVVELTKEITALSPESKELLIPALSKEYTTEQVQEVKEIVEGTTDGDESTVLAPVVEKILEEVKSFSKRVFTVLEVSNLIKNFSKSKTFNFSHTVEATKYYTRKDGVLSGPFDEKQTCEEGCECIYGSDLISSGVSNFSGEADIVVNPPESIPAGSELEEVTPTPTPIESTVVSPTPTEVDPVVTTPEIINSSVDKPTFTTPEVVPPKAVGSLVENPVMPLTETKVIQPTPVAEPISEAPKITESTEPKPSTEPSLPTPTTEKEVIPPTTEDPEDDKIKEKVLTNFSRRPVSTGSQKSDPTYDNFLRTYYNLPPSTQSFK